MSATIGYSGSVKVGSTAVGTAKIWTIDIKADTADTTKFSSGGWKESAATLKGWTGSVTTVFDGGADGGEAALITGLTAGTSVALDLITSASGAGTAEEFKGDAFIVGMPVTNDVNGIIEVTFAFEGTGALTIQAVV